MSEIKDIFSFKEFEFQLKGMEDLLNNKRFLKESGMTPLEIAKMRSKYTKLKREFEEMSALPDKFNDIFSDYGWFAFESLNLTLMKRAIELAETNGVAAAEQEIIKYYSNSEAINLISGRLYKMPEFKKRQHLYKVAVERHFSGDFISSVPLFLIIIDGFVNDIEQTGFFSENTDLLAWDSIVAHEKGLRKISELLNQGRKRTTTDPIDFPFRHGILHGRDLNYGYAIVSTKALNIIFSLSDWTDAKKRMREGVSHEKFSPPTMLETAETFIDSLEQYRETAVQKEYLQQWKKRNSVVGVDFPAYGESTLFEDNSPEKSMVELIEYINKRNYGKIAQFLNINSENFSFKKVAGEMRNLLTDFKVNSFKLIEVEDKASAVTEITIELTLFIGDSKEQVVQENFRWVTVDSEGEVIPRNYKIPSWKLTQHPFLKWGIFKKL